MYSQIPHLVELGVNAVELLPIFEFDEFEFQRMKNPRDHLVMFLPFILPISSHLHGLYGGSMLFAKETYILL